MFDFASDETHLLLNPRLPHEERDRLERLHAAAPVLRAHVWLATSGTTGALKLVALSKRALLASADAVNRRLEANARDVWCCMLPAFHVGGLGIHARAFLSGARVVETSWDPWRFASMRDVTLASLVPAQLVDLVRAALRAPGTLRAIVVGGGAVSDELYGDARALGWPVLPSYGMTECCSQVATALPTSAELVLLDHLEARVESDGRLAFRGESLLTGYATAAGFVDPKIDGWFIAEDRGAIDGRVLRVYGRAEEFVKIGGESVDLGRLDRILAEISAEAAVVAIPDDRLGHVIHLAVAGEDGSRIADEFNARVVPFERARGVHRVDAIPRTALGKLRRAELAARLERR